MMPAIRQGTNAEYSIRPIASTSSAKIAPARGVAEAGGNARHQQHANAGRIEPRQSCDRTGQTAAELDGRSLPTGRSAKQMRRDRADENQRRHSERHPTSRLVDLLDDEIISALSAAAGPLVEQSDREATDRQEEKQPRMREARPGRDVEAPQEGCTQAADREHHRHEDQSPAQYGHGMLMAGPYERRQFQGLIEVPKCRARNSSLLPDGDR